MADKMTLYEFLEIPTTCTIDELKSAWRKKVKLIHPDVNGGDALKTTQFVQANDAYQKEIARKEAQALAPKVTINGVNVQYGYQEANAAYEALQEQYMRYQQEAMRQMKQKVWVSGPTKNPFADGDKKQEPKPGGIFRWFK